MKSYNFALLTACVCLSITAFSAENTSQDTSVIPVEKVASDKVNSSTLLAADAKARKKKKNNRGKTGSKSSDEPAPPSEPVTAAPGKTIHKAQEGIDSPYKWHAALTSSLSRRESQTGEAKSGTGHYDLHFLAAYIIGHSFEVGPSLVYTEQTTKFEEGDPSVTTAYDAGIHAAYNIGNLDKSVFVPFVKLGFAMSSLTNKTGDKEAKGTGTKIIVGGGLHYFVDSNVALTADLAYGMGSKKFEGAEEETKTTDLDLLNLGFSLFL